MNALVIVLVVVVVLGVIALIAFNPLLKNHEDAAITVMRERFGDNERLVVEPRATAMGTEPDEAGGVHGMSVLAVNTDHCSVTWSGLHQFSVARSAITSVESSADDPEAVQKATIIVNFTSADRTGEGQLPAEGPRAVVGQDWLRLGPELARRRLALGGPRVRITPA